MKYDDGFFLAELLLSLSVLLLIALTLVPLFIEIVDSRYQQRLHHDAHHFLYEELISAKIENRPPEIITIEKDAREFTFIQRFVDGREEVCVQYGEQAKKREVCEYVY